MKFDSKCAELRAQLARAFKNEKLGQKTLNSKRAVSRVAIKHGQMLRHRENKQKRWSEANERKTKLVGLVGCRQKTGNARKCAFDALSGQFVKLGHEGGKR